MQIRCNPFPDELFAAAVAEDSRADGGDDEEVT